MNVTAVRNALADLLEDLGGQASAYVLAQPTPPGFQIPPPAPVHHYAMGQPGMSQWAFVVQGFVALNNDIAAQMILDDWCATSGTLSVIKALEADKTLGGLVDNVVVTDQTPGRQVEQPPGNPMLLVEWHLTIYG